MESNTKHNYLITHSSSHLGWRRLLLRKRNVQEEIVQTIALFLLTSTSYKKSNTCRILKILNHQSSWIPQTQNSVNYGLQRFPFHRDNNNILHYRLDAGISVSVKNSYYFATEAMFEIKDFSQFFARPRGWNIARVRRQYIERNHEQAFVSFSLCIHCISSFSYCIISIRMLGLRR